MQKERVLVSVFNPKTPVRDELQGLFIEENGYVSLPATAFHRKFESEDVKMSVLPGLGFEGAALQIGSPIAPLQMYRSSEVPRVDLFTLQFFSTLSYQIWEYSMAEVDGVEIDPSSIRTLYLVSELVCSGSL